MKLIAIIFLLTQAVFAKDSTYYPQNIIEQFKSGDLQNDELKELIHTVLNETHQKQANGHDTLGCSKGKGACYKQKSNKYSDAKRELFGFLHLERLTNGQYMVEDVYCEKEFTNNSPKIGKIGPKQIPNHTVVNCEHTWPQSKFSRRFNSNLQRGDLHHLYPTDSRANSVRSSYDFGWVKNGKSPTHNCDASKFGNRTYEPPHKHKGNVARAMFYFSVRYKIGINTKMEEALRQWHELDPVDEDEMQRNESIYDYQKNRNPFIDYPELVDSIANF